MSRRWAPGITVSPRERNVYRQINLAEWNVKWRGSERSIGRQSEGKQARGLSMAPGVVAGAEGGAEEGVGGRGEIDVGWCYRERG